MAAIADDIGGATLRTILCYGDSNTWGYNPKNQGRYGPDVRWPGVLRRELGSGFSVIEEGLNGRTTVWDDPTRGWRSGKDYLPPCLESHSPIHLVVIMLGTNDLKYRFSLTAFDIAQGARTLVEIVQKSAAGPGNGSPEVLLIAPPPVAKLTYFAQMFKGSEEKSKELSKYYLMVAREMKCHFLDAAKVIASSDIDGIHFEAGEHEKLGMAVAAKVREVLGDR